MIGCSIVLVFLSVGVVNFIAIGIVVLGALVALSSLPLSSVLALLSSLFFLVSLWFFVSALFRKDTACNVSSCCPSKKQSVLYPQLVCRQGHDVLCDVLACREGQNATSCSKAALCWFSLLGRGGGGFPRTGMRQVLWSTFRRTRWNQGTMLVRATRQETNHRCKLLGAPLGKKENKCYCSPLAAQVEGRLHCVYQRYVALLSSRRERRR